MESKKIITLTVFILTLITIALALTNTESTSYLTKDETISGIIFPAEVTAQVGSDVAIKLINPYQPPQVCEYRTPLSNKNTPIGTDRRVLNWDLTSCGVIIKNVTKGDEGFWRLTSKRDNEFIRGVMSVVVNDKIPTIEAHNMMIDEKEYCVIRRPDSEAFPQLGDCKIPENHPGQWIVNVGLHGKYMEEQKEVFVEAKVGKLVTKIERDSMKMSLSCNVVDVHNIIDVCRFVRTMDDMALQVYDGLGGERYRYFGTGFEYGECGLTIDNPDVRDRGLWKCYVKSMVKVAEGEDMQAHDFGSIIDAGDQPQSIRFDPALGRQVLLTNTSSTLYCHTNLPIGYCWFRRPNGEILSVSEEELPPMYDEKTGEQKESKNYWYNGLGFGLGDCQITLNETFLKPTDVGNWRCSVGQLGKTGYETYHTFNVEVRETDPMIVAETGKIDVDVNRPFQIECRTLLPHTPIESCHFVTPVGSGFSINEEITAQNSFGNFHFNPNRKMKSGYCSLMVTRARKEYSGTWYCFAKSTIWQREGSDKIQVVVRDGISIAGTTWMGIILAVFFIVVITAVIVGVLIKRRRRKMQVTRAEMELEETRRTSNESSTDAEANTSSS